MDKLRVLCVDDERGVLELTKIFLEDTGEFIVDTELDAKKVLSRLYELTYDAIVSDYQMPSMDGLELLEAIRGLDEEVPFILFTGRGREEVVIKALNLGANAYVQKGGDTAAQFAELMHQVRVAAAHHSGQVALRESESKYRSLFENLNEAVMLFRYVLDGNGEVVDWLCIDINEAAVRVLSVPTKGSVVGRTVMGLFGHEAMDGYLPLVRDMRRKKQPTVYEGLFRPANRYVLELFAPVSDQTFIVSSLDLTERKRMEDELRHNLEVLIRSQEVAQLGSWTLDFEADKFVSSDVAPRVYGLGEGEAPTVDQVLSLTHPDDRKRYTDFIAAIQTEWTPAEIDYRIIRPDGSLRYIHGVAYSSTRSPDGKISKVSGIVQDVTDWKQAEEALRECGNK